VNRAAQTIQVDNGLKVGGLRNNFGEQVPDFYQLFAGLIVSIRRHRYLRDMTDKFFVIVRLPNRFEDATDLNGSKNTAHQTIFYREWPDIGMVLGFKAIIEIIHQWL